MKRHIFCSAVVLATASLIAAETSPKDDVTSAAKALGEKANYSWRTTVVVPEDAPFHPGPTDGKTEKDGLSDVKFSFGDNTAEYFVKGDQAAVTSPDGGWQSLSEMDNSEGPGRFMILLVRNFKTPAAQAGQIAASAKELKRDGDDYSSDLTEEGAKTLLTWRGGGATASNAKGSAKFWVKDGVLSKYEYKVAGSVNFNGNDVDVERTTTVEIKDVGTTKINLPDDAKKKLEPPKAEPAKQ
jgi:hypothetical protein